MKKKIEQLLDGKFEYEQPKLLFSQDKIEICLKAGTTKKGEVFLGTEENRKIQGYVISSNRRVMTKRDKIAGTTVCVQYGVDAVGMQPGDKLKGSLHFVTNLGEYELPFEITTEEEKVKSSLGTVDTIEDLVETAKNSYREAYRLFANKSLFQLLEEGNMKEKALYEGMVQPPLGHHNLEEFLIGMEEKKPTTFFIRHHKKELYEVNENRRESIVFRKNGWGHFLVDIEVQGDFIEINKRVVTEDDFIGSYFELEYIIHKKKLEYYPKIGKVLLKNPYHTEEYTIIASRGKKVDTTIHIEEKKHQISLLKQYIDQRLGNTSLEEWVLHTQDELFHMIEEGFDYLEYQFFRVYLFSLIGENDTAREILRRYQDRIFSQDEIELAGVYLWLCSVTGLYRDHAKVVQRLQSLYMQKEDSILLFLILLEANPELRENKSSVLFMLEEMFEKGCSSPLLYMEAWEILKENPDLFRRINHFWTQVFLFAGKHGILTEKLAARYAYLSGYQKTFRNSVYRVLAMVCENYPSTDTLEAVCKYIIKENPRKKEYFKWYSMAVDQGLRLTRLYEYYVETMDTSYQRELPKPLLMYFSYNNDVLSDDKKAFLYASVVNNKEREPKTYEAYKEHMKSFAERKIKDGSIDENYALLYQEFLCSPETEEDAHFIAERLFTSRLYCDHPSVRYVIVRHGQLNTEEICPCIRGIAYPQIYTEDAVILLQDEQQRRFTTTISYNHKKLMDERAVVPQILEKYSEDPGILLNYCENHEINEENMEFFQKVTKNAIFSNVYKDNIRKRILSYYSEHVGENTLSEELPKLDLRAYAQVDKKCLLELLILHGLFEEAMKIIEEFGFERIDVKDLLKLTSHMLSEKEEKEDELLSMAEEVYKKGYYDEKLLKYLVRYVNGPIELMVSIWKSACGFEIDTYDLEEKILKIMMYTSDIRPEGEEILKSYMSQSGKEWIAGAYLTMISYHAFVKEKEITPFIRECLETAWNKKWPVNQVCHFVYLKSLTQDEKMSQETLAIANQIVKECSERGIMFSFFTKLPVEILSQYQMDDKTCVEYFANPRAKVTLHYCLDNGLEEKKEYTLEPLRNIYQGVFGKTFTLFYGEILRYYFVVEEQGETIKTEEKEISMHEQDGHPMSKYQLLNQILSARKLGKDQEIMENMKRYLRQEQYVRKMFTLKKEQ